MARVGNPTDSYPGVGVAFEEPVTAADCCGEPTTEDLVADLEQALAAA